MDAALNKFVTQQQLALVKDFVEDVPVLVAGGEVSSMETRKLFEFWLEMDADECRRNMLNIFKKSLAFAETQQAQMTLAGGSGL